MTLIRLDVQNLFDRILARKEDYLMILSLKRTREHFCDVFYSKYGQISIDNLKELDDSTIAVLDSFYQEVDQLKWYLLHTEDLPAMLSDRVDGSIKKLKDILYEITEHLNSELRDQKGPPPLSAIE
ncbi:MAG: hypothetical protein OXB88_06030 [Bacteriovoracales bacterium]|nr:hypothetical protein [Bacteriovoracales bacterium]